MEAFLWYVCCTIVVVLLLAVVCRHVVLALVVTDWYWKWFASFENNFIKISKEIFRPAKQELFGQLKKNLEKVDGDVLEIGIGGGANLPYYPPGTSLVAVDMNQFAEDLLRENIKKLSANVHLKRFVVASADDMRPKGTTAQGIADKSMAAVVSTNLLCSLTEAQLRKTLQEVKRVLKPGGRFFFLEHVLDKPGTLRSYIQQLIEMLGFWPILFGGCHVARKTWLFLEEAGFESLLYKRFCAEPPPELWSLKSFITAYIPISSVSGYAGM